MKAASNALSLAGRHPDRIELVLALTELAKEEIDHYQRVVKLLAARGLSLGTPAVDVYAQELRRAAHGKSESGIADSLVDRLLIGALIEARSCERFKLVADAIPAEKEPELYAFYTELFACEAKHFRTYRDLAVLAANGNVTLAVEKRLARARARAEGEIVRALCAAETWPRARRSTDDRFRFARRSASSSEIFGAVDSALARAFGSACSRATGARPRKRRRERVGRAHSRRDQLPEKKPFRRSSPSSTRMTLVRAREGARRHVAALTYDAASQKIQRLELASRAHDRSASSRRTDGTTSSFRASDRSARSFEPDATRRGESMSRSSNDMRARSRPKRARRSESRGRRCAFSSALRRRSSFAAEISASESRSRSACFF